MGLPKPVAEHRFDCPPLGMKARMWRFDYAWPEAKVALEVEGGGWIGGRHTSGKGFEADMEKYSEAAAQGWRLIRRPPKKLMTLQTIDYVKRARTAQ
jgi:hypothetical protein